MEIPKTFENYPARIVILSNTVSILIYVSGLVIMARLGRVGAILYLAFILAIEFRLLSRHCVNCYYWGRTCGFGRGRVSAWFFKKGEPSEFCAHSITWKEMIPDMLVTLIPLVTAIILMIIRFNLILLIAALILIALTTAGNGFVRGNLTCKHCRQRETGCPAEQLFNKK